MESLESRGGNAKWQFDVEEPDKRNSKYIINQSEKQKIQRPNSED